MSDAPISALPAAGPLANSDEFAIVPAGVPPTSKATLAQILEAVNALAAVVQVVNGLTRQVFLPRQAAGLPIPLDAGWTDLIDFNFSLATACEVVVQCGFEPIYSLVSVQTNGGCFARIVMDSVPDANNFVGGTFVGDSGNPDPTPVVGEDATYFQQWLYSLAAGPHNVKLQGSTGSSGSGAFASAGASLLIQTEPVLSFIPVLAATVRRVTEAGDFRLTEAGDFRVLEE